jgi:LPS export ABC transporter permease LptG/LPS export ABC transporter permease LptF
MRILSRYIFREIFSSALLGTFLATAIIFLQRAGTLFEVVVRSSTNWETMLYLFLLALPQVLPLTIPFGVLIGILIGLGRLSSDGEITAMRAAGVPSRTVLYPVLLFAVLATCLAGFASIRLTPWALRETFQLLNKLLASRVTVDIQPRVFDEEFANTNTILYVGDVNTEGRWRNIFMADVTPPEQRQAGLREKAEGPRVTISRRAIASPDAEHNRIQLSMEDVWTHEMGKDFVANDTHAPTSNEALDVAPPAQQHGKPVREMSTSELRRRAADRKLADWLEAKIELNWRFALPPACLMLALVGVPLGVASRKGSKSSGYVTGVFLAFFCYWLAFLSLSHLAQQRTLPAEVALWLPNAVFGIAGLIFIGRLERPGDRDIVGALRDAFLGLYARVQSLVVSAPRAKDEKARVLSRRFPVLPQLVDMYVLSSFLNYFLLWLATFVFMAQVYNFFELLGDIVAHKIPLSTVFTYLLFLAPKLIYDTLPISVLVAVLVTYGIMTKNNEITAFKACGVSLYRLAMPVLLVSALFSVALFAFDFYYVPQANVKQDALRNQIKGKAPQTYLRPDRKWIFGNGSRIFYYKVFDKDENVMGGVSVYELDPKTFHLTRWISADRAEWKRPINSWIFQNGWVCDFKDLSGVDARRALSSSGSCSNFRRYQAETFAELTETPNWFLKEVVLDTQMNFIDLERYIAELKQSGFDTVKLQVRFFRKFSVPLFALIMAMLAVPFSFLVGNRGAMAGIGMSLGVMIAYEGLGTLFEKMGDVALLPPALAAWAPDTLFALTGLYLLLRMRS